jgi:predicted kinase
VATTAHLICGLPCSGKTTYATALRADANCVLFSLDQWLITTFGRYAIPVVGHEEHTRRVLACRQLIWSVASEFLRRSIDVVLDDGFFFRENRERYAGLAAAVGASSKVHFIDTPLDEIRVRLAKRNSRLPRYNFEIDPETLLGFVGLFEAPASGERSEVVVVRSGSQRRPTRDRA